MNGEDIRKKEFIREQIKDKPLSRKQIAGRLAVTVLCGILFALVIVGVISLFAPWLRHILWEENKRDDTPKKELLTDTEEGNAQTEVAEGGEDPASVIQEPQSAMQDLTLEEYQKLQNQLYDIGLKATDFLVEVTSKVSAEDWFQSSYETVGKECGVLIGVNREELLILVDGKNLGDETGISVTFYDGSIAEAVQKNHDGNTGITVLSVDRSQVGEDTLRRIREASFGDTENLEPGNIVIAVGNPLEVGISVASGNITSVGNEVSILDTNLSVLTTDIAGSGNASGILLNTSGELIGLIMQDYSLTRVENTLTAVDLSNIEPVLDMLLDGKQIPYLGMHVSTVTDSIAAYYDLPKGIYVGSVSVDSPAGNGGIQSGDVITGINGIRVATVEEYYQQMLELIPGASYEITVSRKGTDGFTSITCNVEAGILK